MICEKFEDMILEDLDGRLESAARARLAAHLNGCPACREFAAGQAALDRELKARPRPVLSPAFSRRVLAALPASVSVEEHPPELLRDVWWRMAGNLAGIAALAAAAGFTVNSAAFHLPAVFRLASVMIPGLPWLTAAMVMAAGTTLVTRFEPAPR